MIHFFNQKATIVPTPTPDRRALILSGGGARAAYQVGVLAAIGKMLPKGTPLPFPILCGTSAGALNATMLATNAHNFTKAVARLSYIWRHLTPDQVYETHAQTLLHSIGKILVAFLRAKQDPDDTLSLLDNTPLEKLLKRFIALNAIDAAIESKELLALAITCMNYSNGTSTTFFQAEESIAPWKGFRRQGIRDTIRFEHLLASSAIPTIFPATKIGHAYYGDGAMRQRSPISPALQLGANKILIIGVSGNRNPKAWNRSAQSLESPSIGQITGQLLNSAFIDNLEGDMLQLDYINKLLAQLPETVTIEGARPIDSLIISPSEEIDHIAATHLHSLPKNIRRLLSITGNKGQSSRSAASYLLFTPSYCQALIELGQKDAMWEKDKILQFLSDNSDNAP